MSHLQSRPFSGLQNTTTLQAGVLALTAVAQVVHTLDPNALSEVDLFINNPTAAPIACTVSVIGVNIIVNVAAFTTLQILDAAPLRGPNNGTPATITALGNTCILFGRVRIG